ncbi:MAG: Mov34/MPN/PAD-1 family protein [Armatimonadota bacterium]
MKILRQVLESVAAQARAGLPHECCGILLSDATDPSTISRTIPAKNAEKVSPSRRYVLGHEAHLKAVDMEVSGKSRIVGYYHSHPCSSEPIQGKVKPSHRDAELAVPEVTYLIVAPHDESIHHAAWRLEGDELVPQPLEVTE